MEAIHQKYLSDCYYEGKAREFHEFKLGQMTMDEYVNKFLLGIAQVCKIYPRLEGQSSAFLNLSGLPQSYRDRIEFYEPQTL